MGGNPLQHLDDLQLASMAAEGMNEAFDELVRRYSSRVYGLCFSMLGNRSDAEDCAQETFLKAYRSIASYRDIASFYTWVYRIARNTCLDLIRARHRKPEVSMEEEIEPEGPILGSVIPDRSPLPDELAEVRADARAVRAAIASLSPSLRDILVLREIEGMAYQEIAALLSLSEGTVKSRLNRARGALLKVLRKREPLFR